MVRRPSYALSALALLLALAAPLAGCGKSNGDFGNGPVIGKKSNDRHAARTLGFPAFATKNTTRVGGADPTADAAGVAQAVYNGQASASRPAAVTLVPSKNWQAGIAAAVLMGPPIRAPILLTDGSNLPDATAGALPALAPAGAKAAGGAQAILVAGAAKPSGLKTTEVKGSDPFAVAAQIDRLQSAAAGRPADRVIVTTGEQSAYAMPAAAWAAKSGDPVLFAKRDSLPPATKAALVSHQQPKIYVLGPSSVLSDKLFAQLRKLGKVTRVGGKDPVANAVGFARFADGDFGWGVVDPGHGLVFASADRPLDAAAAAPLSASGTYGPLLLTASGQLPAQLIQYLLDIQPGFEKDPVRGVYNHGWLIGDDKAISVADQARIDALLEIVPVTATPEPAAAGAPKKKKKKKQ